jgi:uncharacterized membrane protein YhaH (DUF805 family)
MKALLNLIGIGRASRGAYWGLGVPTILATFALLVIVDSAELTLTTWALWIPAAVLTGLAVARLRDAGGPGWAVLLFPVGAVLGGLAAHYLGEAYGLGSRGFLVEAFSGLVSLGLYLAAVSLGLLGLLLVLGILPSRNKNPERQSTGQGVLVSVMLLATFSGLYAAATFLPAKLTEAARPRALVDGARLSRWLCAQLEEPSDSSRHKASFPGGFLVDAMPTASAKASDPQVVWSARSPDGRIRIIQSVPGKEEVVDGQRLYPSDRASRIEISLVGVPARAQTAIGDVAFTGRWLEGFGEINAGGFLFDDSDLFVTDRVKPTLMGQTATRKIFAEWRSEDQKANGVIGMAWESAADREALQSICRARGFL